jgi:hypothetical protein
MHWHIEDVIVEFLPPRSKREMNKCYWHKWIGYVNGFTTCVLKNPFSLYGFLDIFSGLEKFMKEQSWRHLATSQLSGHHVWLVVFIGAVNLPSSTKFCWQDAWVDEGIEDFYGTNINAPSFKAELTRKGQIIIV